MATYFIRATGGNNGNSGLTHALAWATWDFARAVFAPGDIIQFEQSGTYTFAGVYSSEMNGLTFRSYDAATSLPGSGRARLEGNNSWMVGAPTGVHDVVFDSLEMDAEQDPDTPGTAWSIITCDNPSVCNRWTIRNCILKNAGRSAIVINGHTSQEWLIEDNEIFNTGDNGVLFNHCGPLHIFRGNIVHDTGLDASVPGAAHGLYSAARRCIIEDNEFYRCAGSGQAISIREGGEVVRRNLIHDTYTAIGWFDYSDDRIDTIRIYDNIAFDIGTDPVLGTDTDGWFYYGDPDRKNSARHGGTYGASVGNSQHRIIIANNTIHMLSGAVTGIGAYNRPTGDHVIVNNIITGAATRNLDGFTPVAGRVWIERNNICDASATFRWNAVDHGSLAAYQAASAGAGGTVVKGENTSTSDPDLSAAPDFEPQAGSPAINTGTLAVTALHYSKVPGSDVVYRKSAPDIGAVETEL